MASQQQLDEILSGYEGCPGVQVVVASPKGVLYRGATGFADITTHHVGNWYSVSKFFTACAILKLAEQGKPRLDTRVCDIIIQDDWQEVLNNSECTVEQLLCHTAGMPNPLPLSWIRPADGMHDEDIDEDAKLLEILRKNPPKPSPPYPYAYSNVGYWILGKVLATVTQRQMSAFADICQELLWPGTEQQLLTTVFPKNSPMQVGHVRRWSMLGIMTPFLVPSWMMSTSKSIESSSSRFRCMPPHYLDGASYGGLVGSTEAVGSFLTQLMSGLVLNQHSMDLLWTPQIPQMTCGLHIRHHKGMAVYHKEGGGAGCHSSIHFRPQHNLAACVIASDAEFDVNRLLDQVLDCVVASLTPKFSIETMPVASREKDVMLHTKCLTKTNASALTDVPMVLLHGGPGVPDYLQDMAGILLDANICSRVICFDQRGVGQSREGVKQVEISMDLMVSDIECIRKAYGANRIHLVGHSWGGALAQYYAMKCPNQVESMALLSPTTVAQGSDWSDMEMNVMKFNAKKGGWINFCKIGMASLAMMVPRQSVADYAARQLMKIVMKNYYVDPISAPEPPSSFLTGVSAYACFETKNAFIRDVATPMTLLTSTPCLGIFGDGDIYGADRVVSFCEQKQFTSGQAHMHVIRNCGHLVWADQPKELVRLLSSFYAKSKKEI